MTNNQQTPPGKQQGGSQLVRKLAKVMSDVKRVPKNGYNSFSKYNYATESDIAEKVRESLSEQNVVMLPDVEEHTTREHVNRKGYTEYIATVMVKFTFIDGDTGENLSIHCAGEGQDPGDKAIYKAITGAQKYALMKAFMIPTGDDPEADSVPDKNNNQYNQPNQNQYNPNQYNQNQNRGNNQNRPNKPAKPNTSGLSDKQVKRLFAIAEKVGVSTEDVKKVLMADYNKTEVANLTRKEYDEVCERLEAKKVLYMPFEGRGHA